MRLGYFPGCSLLGSSRDFGESVSAVARALEVELVEVPDWNCCGASSAHATSPLLAAALPARVLAKATAAGLDEVVAPCAACYSRLVMARHEVGAERHAAPAGRGRDRGAPREDPARPERARAARPREGPHRPQGEGALRAHGGLLLRLPAGAAAARRRVRPSRGPALDGHARRAPSAARRSSGTSRPSAAAPGSRCRRPRSWRRSAAGSWRTPPRARPRRSWSPAPCATRTSICGAARSTRRSAPRTSSPCSSSRRSIGLALGLEREALGLRRHFVPVRLAAGGGLLGADMSRVGVFVCHCGENIGGTVDCARVAEAAAQAPRRRPRGRLQVHVLRPGAEPAPGRPCARSASTASWSRPARRACTSRPSGARPKRPA